ncbi:hypothetical protein [Prosthecodimorpha staleyi]|uniref:Uncharacterized protein n=1 Tax=Prosthecodimorpha staleyi TaxID=2840188 RepID=A0A947DA80_9HYPH|nr:hypothetical protein [Prosthecodimorpha staleyi]MBT9291307.1 hypothetical protein [Prosthecodimorpha staleyi]
MAKASKPRYRLLEADEIVETLDALKARIEARFPGAGLAGVTAEVRDLIAETGATTRAIMRPRWLLRLFVAGVLAGAVALLAALVLRLEFDAGTNNIFNLVQSIDALVNLTILSAVAVVSLVTAERRLRRSRALQALNPFRAVVHVIDMHQLTKDPGMIGPGAVRTPVSPDRSMTPFELSRYLDYCSELLSLTAKGAALYAIATEDGEIATAVNEIEQLTTNLSQKIWQKIMIVNATGR